MAWRIEWDEAAAKQLKKLDYVSSKSIIKYLKERVATNENPRRFGKSLNGDKAGLWRYRVADYRIVCQIEDTTVTILIVAVGHRKEVYN